MWDNILKDFMDEQVKCLDSTLRTLAVNRGGQPEFFQFCTIPVSQNLSMKYKLLLTCWEWRQ